MEEKPCPIFAPPPPLLLVVGGMWSAMIDETFYPSPLLFSVVSSLFQHASLAPWSEDLRKIGKNAVWEPYFR